MYADTYQNHLLMRLGQFSDCAVNCWLLYIEQCVAVPPRHPSHSISNTALYDSIHAVVVDVYNTSVQSCALSIIGGANMIRDVVAPTKKGLEVSINCTDLWYCFNSYGAVRYFRERSPAIFLRPQNITNHTLNGNFALYSPITDAGIELSYRVITVMKI